MLTIEILKEELNEFKVAASQPDNNILDIWSSRNDLDVRQLEILRLWNAFEPSEQDFKRSVDRVNAPTVTQYRTCYVTDSGEHRFDHWRTDDAESKAMVSYINRRKFYHSARTEWREIDNVFTSNY